MGAGAGQTGGGMQQMPQMGQMPPGVPAQGGIGALAAQGAQMDPRLMAMMKAMQGNPGMGAPGGIPVPKMPGVIDDVGMPGGVPVQRPMPFDPRRPMPVGAGGKGAGMDPRMVNPPRPGVPSTMINPPRPMMPKPQTMAPNRRPGFSGYR